MLADHEEAKKNEVPNKPVFLSELVVVLAKIKLRLLRDASLSLKDVSVGNIVNFIRSVEHTDVMLCVRLIDSSVVVNTYDRIKAGECFSADN